VVACPLSAGRVLVVATWVGLLGTSGPSPCSSLPLLGRGGGAELPPLCPDEIVASAVRLTDVREGIWLASLGPGRALVVGDEAEELVVVSDGLSAVVDRGRVSTGKTISFTAVSAIGGGPVWK